MKVNVTKRPANGPEEVAIRTEYIKLDSFLKLCGAAPTGGEAKTMIAENKIRVNGEICTQRGKKLRPGDAVNAGAREFAVAAEKGNAD